MRMIGVEILKKSNCENNCKLEKFENTVNPIYPVCAISEKMI